MGYSPNQIAPGATDPDPNFLDGKYRDNSPATTNNGTPIKAILHNQRHSMEEAAMRAAGFEYSGTPDNPTDSQLFKAMKASIGNGANLLSNHNFLIQTPDDSQPRPDSTPRTYPPGYQIFSGVFANETIGITNLTYIDGHVSFTAGDFYFAVPNTGAIEQLTEFAASVADFDGKPRTRGVSYALVGDDYRITVGVDALKDVAANPTPLGSVKFEQGEFVTGHTVDNFYGLYGNPELTKIIDLRSFGISGETNASEFVKVQEYINSLPENSIIEIKSGGELKLTGKGTYLTISNAKGLKCEKLLIDDLNSYSGAFDITRFFDLQNIDNIDIDFNAKSTLVAVGGDKQGLSIARINGSKTLNIRGTANKLYQGVEYKNVNISIINTTNNDTRYPFLATGGNGIINANLVNNGCRRDIFIQNGCNGGNITIDSTDIEEASIIAHYVASDSDDLKTKNLSIYYSSKSTGRYDSTRGERAPPLNIQIDTASGVTTGRSEVREIKVKYNIEDAKWGGVIGLRKTIDNFNPDTTGRGYILTNVNIEGRIELGSDNNCVYFNYNTGKNWFTGDQIAGLYLDKLTVISKTSAQIVFNPDIIEDALNVGGLVLIDHNAPSTVISNSINLGEKVVFKRCEFLSYTTRDTQPLSRTTLFRKGWAKIDNGEILIAKVDPYRTVTSVNIYIDLYTPDSTSLTEAISGKFSGNILYATVPNFGFDGAFITEFSKGATLNPVLIGDTSGNISISIPELTSVIGAQLCIDASLCYNQYSGGDNDNIRGMVSKDFELLF